MLTTNSPLQSAASAVCLSTASYEYIFKPSYELPAFLLKANKQSVEHFVTVKEAAKTLNLPPWKIWWAIRKGLLRTYRLINSRLYLRLSDVERLLELSK